MTKQEFYSNIEEIVEAPAGSLRGDEALADLSGWSSLAVIVFIRMADEKLGAAVPAMNIMQCRTVADLAALFPAKITD